MPHIISAPYRLFARASESSQNDNNGGLATNTKIGIAIGLILFAILLISFWLVARYRVKKKPRTSEEEFHHEALDHWMGNVAKPKSHRKGSASTGGKSRSTSLSTMPTYEGNEPSLPYDSTPLHPPPRAHFTQPSAQYRAH